MANKNDTQKYEKTVAALKEMTRDWVNSGVDLFVELRKVEASQVWTNFHKDFETFLQKELTNWVGIHQYRHVIEAIDQHGIELVRKYGVHSSFAMVSRRFDEEPEKKAAFQAILLDQFRVTGMPADSEWVKKQRKSVLQEATITRPVAELGRVAELQRQVTDLKRQLREANARIRELEAVAGGKRKKAA